MSEIRTPPDSKARPFVPVIMDGAYGPRQPVLSNEQTAQAGTRPTRPEIARGSSTVSNYPTVYFPEASKVHFPEMFNRRPSSSQQYHGDAVHQLADRVGRGGHNAASTSTSGGGGYGFTNQLAHVDHLSRHPQHPSNDHNDGRNGSGNGHSAYPVRRRSVDIFRDFTPAGRDYPVRVEKRSNNAARRAGPRVVVPVDPAVWEIDEGLKAAWRAHLDARRREEDGSAVAA